MKAYDIRLKFWVVKVETNPNAIEQEENDYKIISENWRSHRSVLPSVKIARFIVVVTGYFWVVKN